MDVNIKHIYDLYSQSTDSCMIAEEHSRIKSSQDHSSHSDIQSLRNHLQPLPNSLPNNVFDDRPFETNLWGLNSDQQAKEMMSKIIQQVHQIIKLRQQLYYYKSSFFRLNKEYQTLKAASEDTRQQRLINEENLSNLQKQLNNEKSQNQQLKRHLQLKEKDIQILKDDNLNLKTATGVYSRSFEKQLNQEIHKQSQVIMDLMAKNQKIMKINAFLKEQLRIAEGKLVSLEMETQQKTYGLLFENLERLKENHNAYNNKMRSKLSNWQTTDPRTFQDPSLPIQKQQTLKLTSRESKRPDYNYRKESKTVEKDRNPLRSEKEKMRPVEEPKPQRKGQVGEPSRKYQREQSWWGSNN